MNPCPRRAKPPIGFAGTPSGVARQREIEFFGLMGVGRIFGFRTEQEDAAGDRVADEGAALADPFAEAVVVEEALAEIGARIGLPPIEFASQRRDAVDQRACLWRGEARQALQRRDHRKRACGDRPRDQLPRPVADEGVSLRAGSLQEFAENDDEAADRFRESARLSRAEAGRSRLQMLDLDEGEVERIGVDHIVLDALAPRIRNMLLERRRARTAARLLEQKVAVEKRHDDIVGLMPMPPRLRAGHEPPLGDAHMRLRDVNVGRGLGAWGHGLNFPRVLGRRACQAPAAMAWREGGGGLPLPIGLNRRPDEMFKTTRRLTMHSISIDTRRVAVGRPQSALSANPLGRRRHYAPSGRRNPQYVKSMCPSLPKPSRPQKGSGRADEYATLGPLRTPSLGQ